jgi:uncharacterized membrane protein YfcA
MIVAGIYLWISHKDERRMPSPHDTHVASNPRRSFWSKRNLVDADGERYHYEFDANVGIVLSVFVGFVSSLLGVGGGFIHVPILVRLLNFPVHIATATSHFVLAIMALTGTIVHIAQGVFVQGVRRTILLGVGVVVGAQFGAMLSNRVGGKLIIRGLAVALAFVGLRLIFSQLR